MKEQAIILLSCSPDKGQDRLHQLNTGLLRDSFFALKREASLGVDAVRWVEYESGLEDRLKTIAVLQLV